MAEIPIHAATRADAYDKSVDLVEQLADALNDKGFPERARALRSLAPPIFEWLLAEDDHSGRLDETIRGFAMAVGMGVVNLAMTAPSGQHDQVASIILLSIGTEAERQMRSKAHHTIKTTDS
jgi:hypothetical protein